MAISSNVVKRFIDVGLNVIGVGSDKLPTEPWKKYMTQMNIPRVLDGSGVAIICGQISGNLEVLDFDLKYDDTNELYDKYVSLINDNNPDLYSRMVVIQTPSGGYHWLYKCASIEGNKKLARKKNKEVLIETRGEGGYIASLPMDGYKIIQGKFSSIQEIEVEERDLLFACAREFDEYVQIDEPKSNTYNRRIKSNGKKPWEQFCDENNCADLLQGHGWKITHSDSKRTYLLRPGETNSRHSGNILIEDDLFRCWSSSTDFDPDKTYNAFGVYTVLNHGGDFSEAARELYHNGYGDRVEVETPTQYRESRQREVSEMIADVNDLSEYIADSEEDDEYLQSVYDGTLELGKSTGSDALDKHYLFKLGSFVLVVGHTNIGKTLTLLYFQLLGALVHGWKGIIITMENKSGFAKRRLMELYMMKPIKSNSQLGGMSKGEFDEAKKWVEDHFVFLKGRGGKIKTIPQLLNIAYKLVEEDPKIKMTLIDPYSAFKRELKGGQNTHDYDYDVAGDILDFTEKTGVITYLNSHTVSSATRRKEEDGTTPAPYKEDVEGGGKWPNRVDQAIVLHRKTTAPGWERYKTLFYLEKDREIESGGSLTSRDNPVEFALLPGMCEFSINGEASVVQMVKAGRLEEKKGVQSEIEFKDDLPF